MSQTPQFSPSEFAAYGAMQSEAGKMPTSVKVICILGVIFSGFTLLHHLLALTIYTTGINVSRNPLGPAYVQYSTINSWVFGGFSAVSILASIGCLARIESARKALIGYAMTYVVAVVFSIAMTILYVIPELLQPTMPMMTDGSPAQIAAYIGAIIQGICCLPIPVLILIFFGRPVAIAAFAPLNA
jgi:magnesium-transporting ATPase (P-type)